MMEQLNETVAENQTLKRELNKQSVGDSINDDEVMITRLRAQIAYLKDHNPNHSS